MNTPLSLPSPNCLVSPTNLEKTALCCTWSSSSGVFPSSVLKSSWNDAMRGVRSSSGWLLVINTTSSRICIVMSFQGAEIGADFLHLLFKCPLAENCDRVRNVSHRTWRRIILSTYNKAKSWGAKTIFVTLSTSPSLSWNFSFTASWPWHLPWVPLHLLRVPTPSVSKKEYTFLLVGREWRQPRLTTPSDCASVFLRPILLNWKGICRKSVTPAIHAMASTYPRHRWRRSSPPSQRASRSSMIGWHLSV